MMGQRGPADCTVVIRAAGERTEAVCARLAALEVGTDAVVTIHEVPFAQAVRRCFEIGIEAGRDWTLALDADVLLAPGAIGALCAEARTEWDRSPDLFEMDAMVADKLLGQIRPAGVHLYRTALLPEALEHAAFDARRRRPESWVKMQMRRRGRRLADAAVVAGLHDFEQFHRDIFRTVFTHARKHERFMGYAARYWRRMAPTDPDLRMAFLSFRLSTAINEHADLAAMAPAETVTIDRSAFPDDVDAILRPAGMVEKAPLSADEVGPGMVAAALRDFAVAAEYERERPLIHAWRETGGATIPRLRAAVKGYGILGGLRTFGGRAVAALGRRLAAEDD